MVPPVKDIVDEMATGLILVQLMEILSEKTYTGKIDKNPKLKPNKIDNLTQALNFTWSCGIEMKLKPSAEQLHDANETAILGLIWAIMSKYIKIGDDDDTAQLSAKDALLFWARNQVQGYKDVPALEKFTKEWHDGLVLAALIHKNRPKLINYDALVKTKDQKIENLKKVQDAAEKYFGLERYVTAEEITRLDENSMFVYVSEYYVGIAEQRKLDLAAKRISKVIKLTIENDAMRKSYNETAQAFKERLTRVEKILEDRTIDNTMAGAKKRIADFYDYKAKDKNVLLGNQLDLEATYNNLAMRLSHHKRPEFIPPSGLALKDIAKAVLHLEECEQERKIALHAELNRQIKLLQLDDQHKSRHQQMKSWYEAKAAYLKTKELIESVSAAELQLSLFSAYEKERAGVESSHWVALKTLSAELIKEKYERSKEVSGRDDEITKAFADLGSLSAAKKPVLDDALAREKFKEKVRLMNQDHINNFKKLSTWITEKEHYLNTREAITSVSEARTQLSLFDAYGIENKQESETSVVELKRLGKDVLSSKYETQYSKWSIENPEQISQRESQVDNHWKELATLAAEKKRVLDDHLAREEFAEKVRMMNRNHVDRYNKLVTWFKEKEAYLKTKEEVNSVADARTKLTTLDAFDKEKQRATEINVSQLKKIGADTLAQKYETTYSSYVFENPAEIKDRESDVDKKWQQLATLATEKRKVLDADLARELEKERLRLEDARLAAEYTRWAKDAAEEVTVSHFGFTLEEVEAYQAKLDANNKSLASDGQKKRGDYDDVHKKLEGFGVKENPYTTLRPADLDKSKANLEAAQDKRNKAFQTELARQRANDALCKEFAGVADPFVKAIVEVKDKVTQSKAELEDQLKFVKEKFSKINEESVKLKPINDLNAKIEAAGITNNRYTTLTAKDVEVQWEQYKGFLSRKAKMLEEEIEHHKLRGVTPEQFAEIEKTFKQFDADNSGNIDKKELKACLYSLGEEKSKTEIEQIMTKYGTKDKNTVIIKYENFREFMIDLLGVSDTKDDILNSFKLLNKGEEVAKIDRMDILLEEPDLAYIQKTAPAVGKDYNYKVWTDDVFSR